MGRSPGFASTSIDFVALFRLGFPAATARRALTKAPMKVSRRIIMQKARRHPGIATIGLRPLVGMWFQVQYPPLTGVLPIFRSRYSFTIGRQRVFSLGRWTSRIQTRFHVTGFTRGHTRSRFAFAYGTVTHCGLAFQHNSAGKSFCNSVLMAPRPRRAEAPRFRLYSFSLAATGEVEFFFPFLRLLRCFTLPR